MKLNVKSFSKKLDLMLEKADADKELSLRAEPDQNSPTCKFPTTGKALAIELRRFGHNIDNTRISKARRANDPELLSIHVHKDILKVFDISWPCPTYYDEESQGRDSGVEEFRKIVSPTSEKIRILSQSESERRNASPFANPRLFVFDLLENDSVEMDVLDASWNGILIAKPMKMPLLGDGDPFGESHLGFVTANHIRLELIPNGDGILIDVPKLSKQYNQKGGGQAHVRDVGTKALPAWELSDAGVKFPLNENVAINYPTTFSIRTMDWSSTFSIRATMQSPLMRIHIDEEYLENDGSVDPDIRKMIQRVAERKVELVVIDECERIIDMGTETFVRIPVLEA